MEKNKSKRPIRVLHCPTMVGGHPQGLARAERKLGLASWAVVFYQSQFGYETDEVLWTEGESPLLFEIKRWHLLWRALRYFDIIHFNFGQTVMPFWVSTARSRPTKFTSWIQREYSKYPYWLKQGYRIYARLFEFRDLPLLKKANKGIVVTFQGDDARQGDYCRSHFDITQAKEVNPEYYSTESDFHKRRKIATFAKYADRIYALNPDLFYFLPPSTQFMPYAHIDLKEWTPVFKKHEISSIPLVIHAPTHPEVKGTRYILEAVSQLKSEGVRFDFILIEGLPNSKARQIYEKADLLIDQLLVGWYGGVAVELMALGKPVICYIREEDLKFIPDDMRRDLPILNATPYNIYFILKEWLTVRKNDLLDLGRRSRAYVETWHDSLKIAGRLKAEYEAILSSKRQKKDT